MWRTISVETASFSLIKRVRIWVANSSVRLYDFGVAQILAIAYVRHELDASLIVYLWVWNPGIGHFGWVFRTYSKIPFWYLNNSA